jgi:hypothetical protein
VRQAEAELREFGGELVRMTERVFKTQAEALGRMPWMQKAKGRRKKLGSLKEKMRRRGQLRSLLKERL